MAVVRKIASLYMLVRLVTLLIQVGIDPVRGAEDPAELEGNES